MEEKFKVAIQDIKKKDGDLVVVIKQASVEVSKVIVEPMLIHNKCDVALLVHA